MIKFVQSQMAEQVAILHPLLWKIVRELADFGWLTETGQEDLVVTQLFRSREETIRIYEQAGLPAPAASVHEQTPCRGADVSVRMARPGQRYEEWPFLPSAVCRKVARAVNERWRYQESDAHQVALYHSVSGPHIHLQVRPGDETRRRIV